MPIASIPADQLRWRVPAGALPFATTREVEPTDDVIGQDDAVAGLLRGVRMASPGFNVFVVGLSSTGRLNTARRMVAALAGPRRRSRDFAYVANFAEPSRPRLVEMPAGRALPFRRELLRLAALLVEEVPRILANDEVRRKRDRGARDLLVASQGALQRLRARARASGFVVAEVDDGSDAPEPTVLWVEPHDGPIEDAPVHTRAELHVLVESGELTIPRPLDEVLSQFDSFEAELAQVQSASRQAMADTFRDVSAAEVEAVRAGTAESFTALGARWPAARGWLAELHEELLQSLDWFDEESDHAALIAAFTVNVLHTGSRSRKPPVVAVPNPTWQHLFGGIEAPPDAPADHRAIRGGFLLDADGGFLVLSASDLLQELSTWKVLKRALMFGEVDIQNPTEGVPPGGPVLRPDPMRLDVKVILLGDAEVFAALYYGDPDFANVFKIKAEFQPDAQVTPPLIEQYAAFVSRTVRRERLVPFTRDAVCAALEWAVREAGRGGRITTDFGSIADLLRESSFEASLVAAGDVTRAHVDAARTARRRRDDYAERRVLEMIEARVIHLDLVGTRVGQVNALVVYHVGGHDFGRPMRITAAVGVGRRGLVSIERVARMSGRSHDKGVTILEGLLLDRFGRAGPMSFTANLCFEQSYSRVDGDSASLPEALVLLSALARMPLRQDIAVTGSLNQFGEVQAVGGVNEKIEGFFRACHVRGLSGAQGVVLPERNREDLHLEAEVALACAEERFTVWTVSTLDDAVALCLGPPAEVYAAVEAALEGFRRARISPSAERTPPR